MANSINIMLQVVDPHGNPRSGRPAVLYNQDYANPFHPIPTSVVASGTTDGAGRVNFSSIGAGTYDIGVSTTSGISYLRNYVVKNEYLTIPGTTSFSFESRSYVESQSSVVSPGILTQNHVQQTGNVYATNTGTETFGLPWPISGNTQFITVAKTLAKESGNSYYHVNASTQFTQRARMQV